VLVNAQAATTHLFASIPTIFIAYLGDKGVNNGGAFDGNSIGTKGHIDIAIDAEGGDGFGGEIDIRIGRRLDIGGGFGGAGGG
ncbi:Hypothetical predicted protein, partial [Olea europaea subsp. europaea]